jgi:hypothetical protein
VSLISHVLPQPLHNSTCKHVTTTPVQILHLLPFMFVLLLNLSVCKPCSWNWSLDTLQFNQPSSQNYSRIVFRSKSPRHRMSSFKE